MQHLQSSFVELSRVYHTRQGKNTPDSVKSAGWEPQRWPDRVLYRPPQNGSHPGRHSYALGTLTESDGWRLYGLRLLIFPQPLGRALKNQNAAPASALCFRRRRRSPSLHWADCLLCRLASSEPPCSSPVPSCSDVG